MPIYEYYCERDDKVFESLSSIASRDNPTKCPKCGRPADRIMPTTVATMSRVKGLVERVPFHHADVRTEKKQRTIARVKPKTTAKAKSAVAKGPSPDSRRAKPKSAASRSTKKKAR